MEDKDYFGVDKYYHFIVTLLISFYSTESAFAAALTKEYCDSKAKGNHWCWWDIAYDTLGIVIGTTARVLLINRWNWF